MSKIWFITGTSRGFGREWASAALERGDKVAATARDLSSLAPLVARYGDLVLPLELDVTDRAAAFAAVQRAAEHFGRIDVVINNAGYGMFGMLEELSEAEARQQIETNLFGALWVTQAALPIMRAQGSGHIVQVSSIGGVLAFPELGLYHASKWGLEGFSSSLAQEVAAFGIKVTLVEPFGFSTDWAFSSAQHAEPISSYDQLRRAVAAAGGPGDLAAPSSTRHAILTLVDAPNPPLRLFLGRGPVGLVQEEYARRLQEWQTWAEVSETAVGE
ncbi:SDR family NAD(P)-dependent oxidoreductase [Cellulomonas soli]|uniref:Short-chain dehydrogenase/reductase n=1 Tax=Cellulomonas soli TaxID=931535 RepID=A0A512P9N8_9CELL|nr:SDR family NAD(P)-dependent oxidoreductase [Cellulomonas soli]NYI60330.1 NAD(P)-dependent dehydrogenase (short-subunit alcohol dehydrogenase family) [Cellulomonas soli]GEP67842.1 short-chain dehydrogenase/reductase [Cellulomonas soli]